MHADNGTMEGANGVLFVKAFVILTSSLLSVLFGLAPLKILWILRNAYYSSGSETCITNRNRWSLLLCALTCFAGGVFIGTSMLNMIPELQVHFTCVKRLLAPNKSYRSLMAYPWPEFTAAMGFFAVFLLEELTLILLKKRETKMFRSRDVISKGEYTSMLHGERDVTRERRMGHFSVECRDLIESPVHPHRHNHMARSIVILTALSLHTSIESMRYALHKTSIALWTQFWTSNLHQVVLAFALGTQLARTHRRNVGFVIFSICIFSICIPLGFLSGLALDQANQQLLIEETILMVLEGLAVGAFLYVTFYEVLSHELNNEHPGFLKFLCISLGCAAVGALCFFDRQNVLLGEEVH